MSYHVYAQNYTLKIAIAGDLPSKLREKITDLEVEEIDSSSVFRQANEAKLRLYTEGYLLSTAVLNWQQDSTVLLNIDVSRPLKWSKLQINFPDSVAIAIPQGIILNAEKASPSALNRYMSSYLTYLENNGYPFSQLSFDNYDLKDNIISGAITLNPGPFIRFDSLVIKGFDKFSPNVLRYDLRFKKGMAYNEAYLKDLQKYINRVEYLTFTRSPAVAFAKDKTVLYLYIEEVKGNQIDGVIGLNTSEEGKVTFTGDFKLRLLNILKKGEELKVRWQRPDENISNLDLGLVLPYLVRSPFWLEGELGIFRQDSSFVNTEAEGLIKYLIESGTFISTGIDYRSSNVLLATSGDASSNFGSFKTTAYKLGFERRATNRVIIPTRGNTLSAYGFRGNRSTSSSSQEQFGWSLYDAQYFTFFNDHVIKMAINSEALFGENLFDNELYRLGGLKTLRGFNEQSIYASSYGVGTLEYRYMIGKFDYLAAFSDLAYVERKTGDNFTTNLLLGIGTGINFRTKGGIFSLFYALGKADDSPFDFRTSKVHFGYTNRF